MLAAAKRAAKVAAAVGDDRARAVAEGRRGVALAQLVRYEEALPAFQAAAELAAVVGDFDTTCRVLTNIGQVLWIHGDFAGMRAYHERAVEAAQ
jgi:Flp pilus assembly protein TadD